MAIEPPSEALLTVRDLCAWYDESQVLHGMDFFVRKGELVTLLGRNGAGKSTTLKSIMGMIDKHTGHISLAGTNCTRLSSDRIARLGIAYCPEERGIYASLSVEENLMLPPAIAPGGMGLEEIYSIFPNLWERRHSHGTKMSGGEQQMLAIARILRTGATVLMLDEPTEGLAPVIVEKIGEVIQTLKKRGFTILLVEQNSRFAQACADRHYIVEHGRIVDMMDAQDFDSSSDRVKAFLSV